MRYALPYDAGYAALRDDGSPRLRPWTVRCGPDTRTGCRDGPDSSALYGRLGLGRTRGEPQFGHPSNGKTSTSWISGLPVRAPARVLPGAVSTFRMTKGSRLGPKPRPVASSTPTLCAAGGRLYAVEARTVPVGEDHTGRLTCSQIARTPS